MLHQTRYQLASLSPCMHGIITRDAFQNKRALFNSCYCAARVKMAKHVLHQLSHVLFVEQIF